MAKQNFSCRRVIFEPLETRTLLSSGQSQVLPDKDYTEFLSVRNVRQILDQAASQAEPGEVIAVSDRDGHVLGVFETQGALARTRVKQRQLIKDAVSSAMTAAFFESTQDAFSTRTARFIIQDHFPFPVGDTPGGPLYGVEFSSLPNSDVVSGAGISGDPGGIPLYIKGVPVGGIGVYGAGAEVAARKDVRTSPGQPYYSGVEEPEVNEAVALAGASGFMAPQSIQASNIFLAGLRFPFTVGSAATGKALKPLVQLGELVAAPQFGLNSPTVGSGYMPYPTVTIDGVPGQLKNPDALSLPTTPSSRHPFDQKYGIVASPHLSAQAVVSIISNAVKQATELRADIREPVGVSARVHIAVTGLDGQILGVFRMQDATNFSYDVAVQKARTALFFSDDGHAFSTTAVGFLAQAFFPPGINRNPSTTGPLYHIQDDLSGFNKSGTVKFAAPLQNGITIFPGGIPLYQNGKLVGAIGVSGDGVEQDDMIAYAGTAGYHPPQHIRSDELGSTAIASFISEKLNQLGSSPFGVDPTLIAEDEKINTPGLYSDVSLPFVKFPRDPFL